MTGVKDVTLTDAKPEKQKRRSTLSGVKELAARVEVSRQSLANARSNCEIATANLHSVQAAHDALTAAYELVKPQPRARKGAK